ncbi:MAG TPA: glucose-6-phosphate dehydrogenase assembly protein OpcA, partial [Roseiflexaceae bacterium]|nr:glucose-6-phosphate dehydrogenase assembly protein OpcA [Roseiflexaceae bacterium]
IERELSALWKQAADDQQEGGQPVTRTCVLNLVVATAGGRAVDEVTATVGELTARHPNRAIVVGVVPGAADELLDAWVQAHCQMPGPGRPQVCCEQITIEARGPAVARVPGTVLPLLVPDVPVMLWWPRGEPFDSPIFTHMCDLADRIIVDSASFAAPEDGLPLLATLIADHKAISDLAWARLTPWRELIAQFFDAPAMLAHLDTLERVIIEVETPAGEPADRTQALLLVGWLGARLGWQLVAPAQDDGGVTRLALARPDGAQIGVELRLVAPHDGALDRLAMCQLDCARGRFSVGRADVPDAAIERVEVEGMQPIQRVVRLQRMDEATLLAEELRLLGHDHGFEGALRLATELLS